MVWPSYNRTYHIWMQPLLFEWIDQMQRQLLVLLVVLGFLLSLMMKFRYLSVVIYERYQPFQLALQLHCCCPGNKSYWKNLTDQHEE